MHFRQEYHVPVRHTTLSSALLLSLAALCAPVALGQIHAAPSSVTSQGFGGREINGPPASVTSLGPRGYSPRSHVSFSSTPSNFRRNRDHDGRRRRDRYAYSPELVYAVPVPYAVEEGPADDGYDPDSDPNYRGGPTIFDRRGQGASSYVPPVQDVPTAHAGQSGDESLSVTAPAQEPTTLVFKDGHQLELGNYAVVGPTLYDLTPGHARKIALADLDLDATRKVNDDRGVVFQLPPSSAGN